MRLPLFLTRGQITRHPRRKWLPEIELLEDRNAPDNLAPIAFDDLFSIFEDDILSVQPPGVLNNDSDADNDPLTAELVEGPSVGELTFNPDGSFTYVPEENYYGTVTFTYRAFDGTDWSNIATVAITINPVNDAPYAVDDDVTTDEDTPITFSVLGNDFDAEGDSFSIIGFSNPSHGTVTLNQDSTFTYTPAADFHGYDAFTYTVRDQPGAEATATVWLTVEPANDGPIAYEDDVITDEDTAVTIPVLDNDAAVEGGDLSIVSSTTPEHGTVTVNADETLTYTPQANWHGLDKFTYTISESVELETDTAEVWVLVDSVNDVPVAGDDFEEAPEDTPLQIDVFVNDDDVDTEDQLSVIDTSDPEHGMLSFNDDGTIIYTPFGDFNGTDSFTYTLWDGHENGEDTSAVTVTVAAVDDVPIAYNDAYDFAAQGDPNNLQWFPVAAPGLLSNDIDYDYSDAGYDFNQLVVDVQNVDTTQLEGNLAVHANGSFEYQPPYGFSSWTSFRYRIKDGLSASDYAIAWLYVRPPVPDPGPPDPPPPPFANDDEYFFGYADDQAVVGNVSVNDSSALTKFVLAGPPKYGRLTPQNADGFTIAGAFAYEPNGTFAGTVPGLRRTTLGYVESPSLAYTGYTNTFVERSAYIKLQAVKADLDIDGMDENEEDLVGGLVVRRIVIAGLEVTDSPGDGEAYPDNKAPRKKIVIQKPTGKNDGFVLLTCTDRIHVYTSANLDDWQGVSERIAINDLPMTLYVGSASYSETMKDQKVTVKVEGLPGSADTAVFTVLSVDRPEVKFTGDVSAANSRAARYKKFHTVGETGQLGPGQFYIYDAGGNWIKSDIEWGWGFEVGATVHPKNFSHPAVKLDAKDVGDLILERDIYVRSWLKVPPGAPQLTQQVNFTKPQDIDNNQRPGGRKGNDVSIPGMRDDNPSPNDTIYDLDIPGQPFDVSSTGPRFPVDSEFRLRFNARSFATVKVKGFGDDFYVRVSVTHCYYVRFSIIQRRPTGYSWAFVPNASKGANGTTPVSWDLK